MSNYQCNILNRLAAMKEPKTVIRNVTYST